MPVAGLHRFIVAQAGTYAQALRELRAGDKQSHWMWFIFPQLTGLGRSATARFYGIADLAEAQAYLADPLLGARLDECTDAMLCWAGKRGGGDTGVCGRVEVRKLHDAV